MLPTTNVQRNQNAFSGVGNRFRSARNKSVMQKASDMVSSSLSWSSRNAKPRNSYESYKKHDSNDSSQSTAVTIDTSYFDNNIGFSVNKKNKSCFKLSKNMNRKLLDYPWLLPTIVGSSFVGTILILFFTIFSHSSSQEQASLQTPISSDSSISSPQGTETLHKKYDNNDYTGAGYYQQKTHESSFKSQAHGSSRVSSTESYGQSRISMEQSVDYVFNLFHNNDPNRWNAVASLSDKYCIEMPHFTLQNDEAVSTLKGNIGTLIFDIVKYNPIYSDVTPQNVVITNKGTFAPSANVGNKYSRSNSETHCDLVSHLFGIANDLGMLHRATASQHDFDTDAESFWKTHEADVNHKNINQDVNTLFDYASESKFYEISHILPKLVTKHCYHTKKWIQEIGHDAEETFYNSLSRAIFTVHNAEGDELSQLSDNVIGFPVVDSSGQLMQLESGILAFNKHDLESHKDLHYSRCELLDKIVFHGLTMSMNKHIDFMYEAARKDDYYGFEILSDLLDTEYCDIINHKLNDEARNNLGLHLWTLMKDIVNGKFYLMDKDLADDESSEYIITTEGGIMHSKVAINELKLKKSQIVHCSLIKEVIKRGIKHHSGNYDYYHQGQKTNEYIHDFEHRYDDSGLSSQYNGEINEQVTHSAQNNAQLVKDATAVIQHLKMGQETEFIKLLDFLLEQYHSQWFHEMSGHDMSTKRSIKLMIEQTVQSVILGHVNLSSQYDPENDMTILRKTENELEIIHQNDFKTLSKEVINDLERLPLLDEIFKQVIKGNTV